MRGPIKNCPRIRCVSSLNHYGNYSIDTGNLRHQRLKCTLKVSYSSRGGLLGLVPCLVPPGAVCDPLSPILFKLWLKIGRNQLPHADIPSRCDAYSNRLGARRTCALYPIYHKAPSTARDGCGGLDFNF